MSKNKTLKEIFDEKINKDRIYRKVLLESENNRKSKVFIKWSLVPVCLVMIFVSIFYLNQDNYNLKIENPKDEIYINVLDNTDEIIADIDGRWIDKAIEELAIEFPFVKKLNIENEYVRIGKMYASSNINNPDMYNKLVGYNMIYVIDEETYETIDIFFSKTNKVRVRCLSYSLDNLKDSKINNTTLKIAKANLHYIILFKKEGLYFDIEVNNVSEEKLIELLETIIK